MNHEKTLEQLFHHDAEARALETALLDTRDRNALEGALAAATDAAFDRDDEEGEIRLELLAGLWGRVASPRAAEALFGLLGEESEAVQHAAGNALIDLATESFDTFAAAFRAVATAPGDPPPEAFELPFVLAELDDPKVADLVLVLLGHDNPEIVASSLEVAGETGWDERVRERLEDLCDDKRVVALDDEGGEEAEATIGELAAEISDTLRALWQAKKK
jgi:hypothetical protein